MHKRRFSVQKVAVHMASSERPNFVILMAEYFGANVCPGYGNTVVQAPNLTRLAQDSISFDRAYCASPVCGPSRFSFLTGNYVFNTGAYDNGSTIPSHVPTYAHLLTAGGYETAMCGRMHIHGLDTHHGFERRLSSEIIDPRLGTRADLPGKLEPIRPLPPAKKTDPVFEAYDSPIHLHDDNTCVRTWRRRCAPLWT